MLLHPLTHHPLTRPKLRGICSRLIGWHRELACDGLLDTREPFLRDAGFSLRSRGSRLSGLDRSSSAHLGLSDVGFRRP